MRVRILSQATAQLDRLADGDAEALGRARGRRGALEVIGAAEQRADFSRRQIGVRRDDARDRVRAHGELHGAGAIGQLLARPAIQIRHDVAKAIDANDRGRAARCR